MENEIGLISSLIGDPVRLKIMWALLDGKAFTATELAISADTSPQNASMHLAKLVQGQFLTVESQGRHRYYRFARDEVAFAIEALAGLVPPEKRMKTVQHPAAVPVKYCRTCYDHLAGKAGVLVTEGLLRLKLIELSDAVYLVTRKGEQSFSALGIHTEELKKNRRVLARPCLDWSERRHHLAGSLGAALLDKMLSLDWLRKTPHSRALVITSNGRRQLAERFNVSI
jgi:DNA-binding transcriptional ArsR family regulator